NANLNFDTYCSIELDNLGNLWMVNQTYIHVLELNTLPAWLSVKQPKLEAISVYPNPAKETVSIETEALLSEMYLTDQLGKHIRTFNPAEKQFSVAELPSGMYFVEFVTEKGEKSTVKLVKE
ncbi:T9SS type A sorting domain-containing protein, partial [Fluviicola sp. SGL-29]|nr:T9SS type A sorting domain-containing protein [Fluviicola sp. SGL-29]